jgi:hypothetical protein
MDWSGKGKISLADRLFSECTISELQCVIPWVILKIPETERRHPKSAGLPGSEESVVLCLLVSPAVGTIRRPLIHEALAVLATNLRDLLLRHLHLLRHAVSRHGLTIAWIHGLPIRWIGIVSLVVSGRTVSLLDWIASGHISGHLLRHTSCWDERDLSATSEMGTTLAL